MTIKITLKDDYEDNIKGWLWKWNKIMYNHRIKAFNETGDIMNAPCQFV